MLLVKVAKFQKDFSLWSYHQKHVPILNCFTLDWNLRIVILHFCGGIWPNWKYPLRLSHLRFNWICIKFKAKQISIESFALEASRRISGLKNKLHYVIKKKTFARLVLVELRAGGTGVAFATPIIDWYLNPVPIRRGKGRFSLCITVCTPSIRAVVRFSNPEVSIDCLFVFLSSFLKL